VPWCGILLAGVGAWVIFLGGLAGLAVALSPAPSDQPVAQAAAENILPAEPVSPVSGDEPAPSPSISAVAKSEPAETPEPALPRPVLTKKHTEAPTAPAEPVVVETPATETGPPVPETPAPLVVAKLETPEAESKAASPPKPEGAVATNEPSSAPAPALEVCVANLGTPIHFVADPPEAFKQAKKENKLVFILHLSGNFEDQCFT
jgi:hypothetical protein